MPIVPSIGPEIPPSETAPVDSTDASNGLAFRNTFSGSGCGGCCGYTIPSGDEPFRERPEAEQMAEPASQFPSVRNGGHALAMWKSRPFVG